MIKVDMCLCPKCGKTSIIERRSKHGRFYGCNDFAKGCDWKATEKQLDNLVSDGSVRELTQSELLDFLVAKQAQQ